MNLDAAEGIRKQRLDLAARCGLERERASDALRAVVGGELAVDDQPGFMLGEQPWVERCLTASSVEEGEAEIVVRLIRRGVNLQCLAQDLERAARVLQLPFDFAEQGVKNGLPERYSWLAAFGLVVTLVWLYIEILRLIAALRGASGRTFASNADAERYVDGLAFADAGT